MRNKKEGTKPFFKGQQPSGACGCYFPYVTRVADDQFGNRLLYCVNHGFSLLKKFAPKRKRPIMVGLQTMAFRRKEVARLKKVRIK